jgi:UDP-N-acetylmuramoyl-tripeptide--D-alanyl-D-alanine ligase
MQKIIELFYDTTGISTDTRKIKQDCLFLCLKGDNFNGNEFAEKAITEGAKYVIVDELKYKTNDKIYLVDDVLKYLQKLSNYHRKKFNIPVIGITGSNGKTSTKELIKTVLEKKYNVLATEGNLNNHIGVPLTLMNLKEHHEIAIIEMGANKFKDIEELCNIAEPNYGIITNIGKAHLEGFINFDGVLKTKVELYKSISENKGTIIINNDDEILKKSLPNEIKYFTYGQISQSNISGKLLNLTPFIEMEWSTGEYKSEMISTKMIGKYNFYNFLAAITFGIKFNVSPDKINEAITEYSPTNNRSQILKTKKNTLILDCYNANPTSMASAIESFSMIGHPKKIFIIGDMLELGKEAEQEHKNILNLLQKLKIEGYTVGEIFSSSATGNEVKKSFKSTKEALNYFEKINLNDYLILLKGSRGIGLEKLENIL